jgi:hypothetical protein
VIKRLVFLTFQRRAELGHLVLFQSRITTLMERCVIAWWCRLADRCILPGLHIFSHHLSALQWRAMGDRMAKEASNLQGSMVDII